MKVLLRFVISLSFPLQILSIYFQNNACPRLDLYRVAAFTTKCYRNPDVLSTVPYMIKRNGYNFETHILTTSDGYILTLFRILPETKKRNFSVFIQHGILTNYGVWVDIGNKSLAFNLADLGYEVWLGTVRGSTVYSQRHKKFTANNPKFWNFNLDTLASRDIMSQLEYVARTSKQKIHYIGHSMGTTLGLMVLSSYPKETEAWIQSATLLAPVVYLNNVANIELVKDPALVLIDILDLLNIKGLFYQESLILPLFIQFCKKLPEFCYLTVELLFGKSTQVPSDDLLLVYSYWPTGVSIFQLKHYLQIARSKTFQHFDYGPKGNLVQYGREVPPKYDLGLIKVPVCLFYGEQDSLYNKENTERVYEEIGTSNKCRYSVALNSTTEQYSHVDFLYSRDIVKNLYVLMFDVIQRFEGIK